MNYKRFSILIPITLLVFRCISVIVFNLLEDLRFQIKENTQRISRTNRTLTLNYTCYLCIAILSTNLNLIFFRNCLTKSFSSYYHRCIGLENVGGSTNSCVLCYTQLVFFLLIHVYISLYSFKSFSYFGFAEPNERICV